MFCHRQVRRASAALEGYASAFSVRSWHRMRRIMGRATAVNVESSEEKFPSLRVFVDPMFIFFKKLAQRFARWEAVVKGELLTGLGGHHAATLQLLDTLIDDLDLHADRGAVRVLGGASTTPRLYDRGRACRVAHRFWGALSALAARWCRIPLP